MFASFNARAVGLRLSAAETIRLASTYGFDGVDIMVRDAVDDGVDIGELRRKMDDLGLRGGAFPLPFDWRMDEAKFEADLRRLPVYAEAAARLGMSRTGTWVLPESSLLPAGNDVAIGEFHARRLGAIVEALSGSGIMLGLEVIGVESSRQGRGLPYIYRLDQVEALRARLESATGVPIGLLVDSWHLFAADEPIENAFFCGMDRIAWVHVADLPPGSFPDRSAMVDSVRGLPGEHGAVPARELLAELKARGYDGPVTAEPLGSCRSLARLSPDCIADRVARSLRAIWPD